MPLVARDRRTGQRVDITSVEDPRGTFSPSQLECQLCGGEMVVVAGLIRTHHFRHKAACSDSSWGRHPESFEHLRTKTAVARYAREWFGELTHAVPELEVPIPEVRRVADVLFTFPNGWRLACEVQLASITIEQLQQRTDDYLRAGIDALWWLGRAADTPANRAWSIGQYGFVLQLHYESGDVEGVFDPVAIRL